MNSTISYINDNEYHTFTNVEFSGVIVKSELCPWNNITNSINRTKQTYFTDYHLFIKYGDKVYVEVFNTGEIVISYDDLQKNKYLKHYYDLSLLIADNKNTIIKKIKYKNEEPFLYNEDRFWGIDCAFIEGTYKNEETLDTAYKIANNQELYYYKINPYDLENMECSPQEKAYNFHIKCMDKKTDNFWGILLKETYILYKNLIKPSINDVSNITIIDSTLDTSSNIVITDTAVEISSNIVITDTAVEISSNIAITDTVLDTSSNIAITDTVLDTSSNIAITDTVLDTSSNIVINN